MDISKDGKTRSILLFSYYRKMGKTNKQKTSKNKHPGGRPTIMTPAIIAKLEQAFAYGATDLEACFYANISKDALYDYCVKYPEFSERKEALKQKPILKARQTVIDNLNDPINAKWYLERKLKNEFSTRQESELSGPNGNPLTINVADPLLLEFIKSKNKEKASNNK